MTQPIRVMLVDDHPIVRDGLRTMLEAQDQMDVVGEATDGASALQMATILLPEVVVMNIGLPDMNGLEVTRQLLADLPETRVLILTVYENQEYALRAARIGAQGYLVKNVSSDELTRTIEQIYAGQIIFPPRLLELIRSQPADPTPAAGETRALSNRQREVLSLIAEGLSSGAIASRLSLSERTVETHRRHICDRLQIHTVAGLTKYAIAAGLTRLD